MCSVWDAILRICISIQLVIAQLINDIRVFMCKHNDCLTQGTKLSKKIGNVSKELKCACCFDIVPISKSIICTKDSSHVTCEECIKLYIKECVNSMIDISCLMKHVKCEGSYDETIVIKLMTPNIKIMYDSMKMIHDIQKKHIFTPNSYICPNCKKYLLILNDSEKTLHFVCDVCFVSFCVKCNNQADVCMCTNVNNKMMSDDVMRKIIGAIIDQITIHKCPVCESKYVKDDGCNLITCSSCHSYSCWSCGIQILPINGLKYTHFKGSGSAKKMQYVLFTAMICL